MEGLLMERGIFNSNLLEGNYIPQVHAYYYKEWSQFKMNYHQHNSIEIMYMMNGACRVDIEPAQQADKLQSFSLKKGEFILLNGRTSHRLIVEESCRMLNVEFSFSPVDLPLVNLKQLTTEETALQQLWSIPADYVVLRDSEEVYYRLRSLIFELDRGNSDSSMIMQMLFSQLLIQIARIYTEQEDGVRQHKDYYIKQIVAYLHHHYDQNIQVKDVAAAANLHPSYMQRIFKLQTGQTLMEYLNTLRMEKAMMLLSQTDIPINDIPEYVGVGSRPYFHALFKKHTQKTPSEYRRHIRRQS